MESNHLSQIWYHQSCGHLRETLRLDTNLSTSSHHSVSQEVTVLSHRGLPTGSKLLAQALQLAVLRY